MFFRNPGLVFLAALYLMFPIPALAADVTTENSEDLFCPKLQNPAIYDENKFEAYKMLIPGKEGWIFRSESDLRNNFIVSPAIINNLKELNAALGRSNSRLIIFLTPTKGLVNHEMLSSDDAGKYGYKDVEKLWSGYWSALADIKQKTGIEVLGMQPKEEDTFFYKRDHHWRAEGSKQVAQVIADYIKTLPEYKDIEKVEFVTAEAGNHKFQGVSKKVFKKLCQTNQLPEQIVKKITERKVETSSQSDLFGETKPPSIVLLGTSNSTQEPSYANFEGFLKEALSADILNMSVSGGGLDTAMVSYLTSDHYKNNPAKIIIWEIPGYYDLSTHEKFFREVIPAAYGDCGSKALAEAKNIMLEEGPVIVLDKLRGKKISGNEYYLYAHFSKATARPGNVTLRYAKDKEKYNFQHSIYSPNESEFFLELKSNAISSLDKVIFSVPKTLIGETLDVRLCRKPVQNALFKWQ